MNNGLYNKIIQEKQNIEDTIRSNNEIVNSHTVRELLKKRLSDESLDKLIVICAFYEYMNDRVNKEYSFIKEEQWNTFYKRNISKYFTCDVINMFIDEIINNPKLYEIINMCDEKTIKYFYALAKTQHKDSFGNAVNDPAENVELPKQEDELKNNDNEKTNIQFKEVSNQQSLDADKIQLDKSLYEKLTSKNSVLANVSALGIQKIKSRLSIFKLDINIIEIDEQVVLNLKKKNTVHDKIASTSKNVLMDIKNFVDGKKEYLKIAMVLTENLINNIKSAINNGTPKVAYSGISNGNNITNEAYAYVNGKKIIVRAGTCVKSKEETRNRSI